MFLTTTPLLIAAAAVASPDFRWLDAPGVVGFADAPLVAAVDSGEVLIASEDTVLFGRLGDPLIDITWTAPLPSIDVLPAGMIPVEWEATGLTASGAVIVKWTIDQAIRVGGGDGYGCQVDAGNAVWMAWDPVREIPPVTFAPPVDGDIVDIFAVNESMNAVGMVVTDEGLRGAVWTEAGEPSLLPHGAFAHGICNGGWLYGVADDDLFGPLAAVWTPTGERISLGMLTGHASSAAFCGAFGETFGVSEGPSPIACNAAPKETLFRWTPDAGMTPFAEDVPLDFQSALSDLPPTASGRFTTMHIPRETPGPTAYLVDPVRGLINVRDLVPASVWTGGYERFLGVSTIDFNTDTIVGVAERVYDGVPTYRVFALGVELSPADLTMPFFTVDLADLDVFIGSYLVGASTADLNLDGAVDLTDVDLFIEGWLRER